MATQYAKKKSETVQKVPRSSLLGESRGQLHAAFSGFLFHLPFIVFVSHQSPSASGWQQVLGQITTGYVSLGSKCLQGDSLEASWRMQSENPINLVNRFEPKRPKTCKINALIPIIALSTPPTYFDTRILSFEFLVFLRSKNPLILDPLEDSDEGRINHGNNTNHHKNHVCHLDPLLLCRTLVV